MNKKSSKLSNFIVWGCMYGIYIYRSLRPILGTTACCRFETSCSEFAMQALQQYNLMLAWNAIIRRLISCHPFS